VTKKLLTFVFAVTTALGPTGGLLRPVPAMAQSADSQAAPPTSPPTSPVTPEEGPDTRTQKPLSLQEAITAAVANNLTVAIRRRDPEIAQFDVTIEDAVFDPLLGAQGVYGKSKSEPLEDTGSTGNKFWDGSVTLSQLLKQGFSYSVGWETVKDRPIYRVAAQDLAFFHPVVPTYSSVLTFRVNQPLLRGFGFAYNKTGIEIAQVGVSTSQEGFRASVMDILLQTEQAYWDLNAAISLLEVQIESLKLAKDLLSLNQKKVEVGTLAPIQITEAEASVADREQGVILARAGIRNAEDNLRRIMNVAPDAPDWDMALKPTDTLPFEPQAIDLDEMEKSALDGRPEIQLAKNNVKVADLQHRFDQNGIKPQLDAFATFAPNGNNYEADQTQVINHHAEFVPGDANGDGTVDPGEIVKQRGVEDVALRPLGFNDSASEVFNNDIYDWTVGLRFSIPIGNRSAKATAARSKVRYEQSQMSLEDTERGILVEVRVAVRSVETFQKSVDAARANVLLQRKKLEAEQKRYDNGMSTSFQVLTFQNDLTAALNQEIAAITAYNKSLAALGRATATIAQKRGVTIAARAPRGTPRSHDSALASGSSLEVK